MPDPFPSTHWSLVAGATHPAPDARRRALAAVFDRYAPVLRLHLQRRHRIPADEAEDVLQSFVADALLERKLLARAERGRGRFRAFLLTALNRFVVSRYRYERAAKRGAGRAAPLTPDLPVADGGPAPDDSVGVEWARAVIADAIDRMRRDCQSKGRDDVWGVFESRILHPALRGAEPAAYAHLVDRFGFGSPQQASNALVTAVRSFNRALRAAVGSYELSDARVEEELRDLRRFVARGAQDGGADRE
ncbi:MAG: RNA polymerase sigma factor [Phycisphaerae bacterium]|nr:hypothetical protein [Tepidisphaeraceae bacterium]